ncbi:MAG: hypothetical protein HYR94_16255 [Chloroflexi bacterium]|nr:hypothetical protein [Chloroflexota bacterium]
MAQFLLLAHSGWRWLALLLIIITTVKMLMGWLGKRRWTSLDTNLLLYSRIAMYVQVVLGVILYILLQQWTNMRFTGEHVIVALLAVGGVEFGAGRAKRLSRTNDMFKFAFIGFAIGLALILVAITAATRAG